MYENKEKINTSTKCNCASKEENPCPNETSQEEVIPEVEELKKVHAEKNEYLLLAQRIQADFENYKKRNKNAYMDAYQSATVDTVMKFIPIVDNIERALESMKSQNADTTMFKGIEMVFKQFNDVLKQLEVYEIEALNMEFDPTIHEAVLKIEAEQGQTKNTIIEVMQKGYRYKEKIVRHSLVKVLC